MYTNYLPMGKKKMKSIIVTNNNEVILKETKGSIDEKRVTRTLFRRKYQLLTRFTVGNIQFAQCATSSENDWFNLTVCKKMFSLNKGDSVQIEHIADEAFFKVVYDGEKFASIYDSTGELIAKERDEETKIDVVFSASGACLQKTDKTGKKTLYTLEGYLVG